MMDIEITKWTEFNRLWNNGFISSHLRYGQALHQFLQLEKTTQFKDECDKLYQLDGDKAIAYAKQLFSFS